MNQFSPYSAKQLTCSVDEEERERVRGGRFSSSRALSCPLNERNFLWIWWITNKRWNKKEKKSFSSNSLRRLQESSLQFALKKLLVLCVLFEKKKIQKTKKTYPIFFKWWIAQIKCGIYGVISMDQWRRVSFYYFCFKRSIWVSVFLSTVLMHFKSS